SASEIGNPVASRICRNVASASSSSLTVRIAMPFPYYRLYYIMQEGVNRRNRIGFEYAGRPPETARSEAFPLLFANTWPPRYRFAAHKARSDFGEMLMYGTSSRTPSQQVY